jgi:hypothetical protein
VIVRLDAIHPDRGGGLNGVNAKFGFRIKAEIYEAK